MTSNRSEIQWLMTNYVIFFFINYPSNANSFEIPNNGNEKDILQTLGKCMTLKVEPLPNTSVTVSM